MSNSSQDRRDILLDEPSPFDEALQELRLLLGDELLAMESSSSPEDEPQEQCR